MNTTKLKILFEHYYCSFLRYAEHVVTGFLLIVFSTVSLFPAQALAYSSMIDRGDAGRVRFVVPYGPTRDALMGEASTPPSEIELQPNMYISVWASAYSSTVGQTDADPFTTASGTQVHVGTAASNFLPLGTQVLMNGVSYTVEDRMNMRYDNRYTMDVWQPSEQAAFAFGVRLMTIKIVSLP